ncbi:MAG: His-Xaa-Ser system radical SAM maturase HxsB [Candidatus ainarchaeum sp.]|nr:His-Xaa-Ser system radical SAM maturase HxsB [Candidatus ainarchaeum sp.]
MSLNLNQIEIDKETVGFFRFKKLNDFYLLTNDVDFIKLTEAEFKDFLEGNLDKNGNVFKELSEKGFIKNFKKLGEMATGYANKNSFLLRRGVSLHIIVVTKRCNQLCVYCQAGSPELQKDIYDMTEETAKKTVDLIFQSPATNITIEFQGGEPLINWKVIKFIIKYSKEKNKFFNKKISFALVTNLSLMTEEIYDYLIMEGVHICTSLDGPEHVHNKNRPFSNVKGSHKIVTDWVKVMKEREENEKLKNKIAALPTLTRYSIDYIEEVIDEYIRCDLGMIHLRQLSYLGDSAGEKKKKEIGYTAEEFISAWKRGMDHIIQKNKEGVNISERGAIIMLEKIFLKRGNSFLDLRSPCGAGIGQLAYFYDGRVYSCDEGRMTGDDLFLLGNVNDNNYDEIVTGEKTKTLVTASTLDNFSCDQCVYKPYCGTCPVLNYVLYKNIFPNIRMTDKCKIHAAMLDYLFLKIEDEEILKIFKKWIRV